LNISVECFTVSPNRFESSSRDIKRPAPAIYTLSVAPWCNALERL